MMTAPETLTIQSDDGEDVTYTIHPHGAAEGFDLAPKIMALLSAPANALAVLTAGSNAPSLPKPAEAGAGAEDVAAALAGEVEGLFGGVDGAALSGAIKDFGATIMAQGGHKLCLSLLKYTSCTTADGRSLKLNTEAAFSSRYQANYGELFTALYHVIRVNYGPMISRMMKGRDPLDALGGLAKRTRR